MAARRRSSASARRGRRAVALLATAVAAAAAGCGGDDRRDGVEAYIKEANAVQARFDPEMRQANATYAQFVEGKLSSSAADRGLADAEQSLRDAHARLRRVDPPPEAARMHGRLLRVYEANAQFAAETTALGRYLPQARTVLRPIDNIGNRLRTRLRGAEDPETQGAALGRYARGIYGQYVKLVKLNPPPVLFTTHQSQLRRLDLSNRLARQLQRATRRRDEKRVAKLLLRFRGATRAAGGTALSRAAVRAYNERYLKVLGTATALQREQQRLERRFA